MLRFAWVETFLDAIAQKGWDLVGDKSPKSKDKAKKQDAVNKDHKKSAANDKAAKQGAGAPKKGK